MKDYYKILDVSKSAGPDAIKKAYRTAALFWHPDKNKSQNAHEKFIEVCEAYNILISTEKRAIYDSLCAEHNQAKNVEIHSAKFQSDYAAYTDWVSKEKIRAEQLAKASIDDLLTETFHFIDKYGWLLLVVVFGGVILWAMSLKK